jgi:hypothetical protein
MALKNFLEKKAGTSEFERVQKEISNLRQRLSSVGMEESRRPMSPLLTILETLTRPGYAVTNLIREFTSPDKGATPGEFDPLQAFWRGLTLQEKPQGKDIMTDIGVSTEPVFEAKVGPVKVSPSPAGIAGFLFDVLNPLDPINWLTFGAGKLAAKTGATGVKAIAQSFGDDVADYLVEKLGREVVEKFSAPTVGKLAEEIMDKVTKLGVQSGINASEVAQRLATGLMRTGTRAETRLIPEASRALTATLQVPFVNRPIASAEIPGTRTLMDILSSIGRMARRNPLVETAGKAFSTDYVPTTVPESVWTRFVRSLAPKASGEAAQAAPTITRGAADVITREAIESTPEAIIGTISGTEAYKELQTGLKRMMEKSRIEEQRFMKEVEEIFKGLTPQDRKDVLQAVLNPERITPRIANAVEKFKQWRQQIVETYRKLGVEFTPMEAYVPFITTGKPLSKDELALLKSVFGTGIREVQSSDLVEMVSKYDPNLIPRTTKAINPAEVNKVLGREWLTEDAAVAMARRGIRAIRGEQAATFLQGMIQKYGLTVDDVTKLKGLPEGYVLVVPKPEVSGRISLEATPEVVEKAIALPQEFVKAYNDYTDLLFNTAARTAFGRFWDDVTRVYKTMAYMWNPGHIPRDLGSNIYNLWLMDVRSPLPFAQALRAIYDKNFKFTFKNWTGTGEELIKLAEDLGLMDSGPVLAEFLQAGKDITFRVGGKYTEVMRKATRAVDDYSRLVGFIDRLAKGDTPEQAVAKVKKYLFDYFDLTSFEKRWMKRIIPFYTWLRKNIPLQIETLLTKPGKYATTYEVMRDIGAIPEPEEVPDFILKSGGIRLPGESQGMYVIPNLPFSDIGQIPTSLSDVRELASMINPLARAPIEILTNTALFSGQPLERYSGEVQNIPLAELIQRLTGVELPKVPSRTVGYLLEQIPPLRNLSVIANPEHPRQVARLISILGGPQIYPEQWAQEAATYEERDALRDLIRYLEDIGLEVPTVRELKKQGTRKTGLAGFLQKRAKNK